MNKYSLTPLFSKPTKRMFVLYLSLKNLLKVSSDPQFQSRPLIGWAVLSFSLKDLELKTQTHSVKLV